MILQYRSPQELLRWIAKIFENLFLLHSKIALHTTVFILCFKCQQAMLYFRIFVLYKVKFYLLFYIELFITYFICKLIYQHIDPSIESLKFDFISLTLVSIL